MTGKGYEILAKLKGSDEPFFVLRAQDILAIPTIESYIKSLKEMGRDDEFVRTAEIALLGFYGWARKHPERLKLPD